MTKPDLVLYHSDNFAYIPFIFEGTMRKFTHLILLVPLLYLHQAHADEGIIYLRCTADTGYVGSPHILINAKEKILTILPLKEGIPLIEKDTEYEGLQTLEEKILTRVTINKFTLRYRFESAIGPTQLGKCILEDRKI
jgi:hypothetical protein